MSKRVKEALEAFEALVGAQTRLEETFSKLSEKEEAQLEKLLFAKVSQSKKSRSQHLYDKISKLEKENETLTETCREFAKDLNATLKVAAETINDYQVELEQSQKEITDLKTMLSEGSQLYEDTLKDLWDKEAKIEAANKILLEKLKEWREAYSFEANDLQAQAIRDLDDIWDTFCEKKEPQT